MNTEQLKSTRLARWSQNGEARLTAETTSDWLNAIGFCPYLPQRPSDSPAPSFLEAVVGRPAQQPSAGERSRALELFARLIDESLAVPLKLGASLGEQPDFVVSADALRYIYALRGNRNFKAEPSTVGNEKVTPLALHCWQAIREQGPLDVTALQPVLGRDMTEAAISRALHELWIGMYMFPVLSAKGRPPQWELLSRRFPQQVAAGAATGHAEAQSAVVSLYLHAAVAATEEEILAFLSPLAAQSKLREVIRGLGSMRQLDIIDIGGRAHVCLQGGLLPEMVAQLSEEQLASSVNSETGEPQDAAAETFRTDMEIEPLPSRTTSRSEVLRASAPSSAIKKFIPKKFVARDSASREDRPFRPKRFDMHASGRRPNNSGASRFSPPRPSGDFPPRPPRPGKFASGSQEARSDQPYSRPPRGPADRGKQWEKPAERNAPDSRSDRPFRQKRSFQNSGSKSGGFKSSGFKPRGGGKPWASKSDSPRRREDGEPTAQRERRDYGGHRDQGRPQRFGKFAPGDRPPARPSSAKPSGFQPRGGKPWTSKDAESRAGGKNFSKPFPRTEGARPWLKHPPSERDAAVGSDEINPKRREGRNGPPRGKSGPKSGTKPDTKSGKKRGPKPFWAKNPRGGKGSVPASRSNRPRGKSGGKKSGKRK